MAQQWSGPRLEWEVMMAQHWLRCSILAILAGGLILGSSCRQTEQDASDDLAAVDQQATWSGIVFGIPMQAQFYGLEDSEAQALRDAIEETARRYEASFSLYSQTSELSLLNEQRVLNQPSALMLHLSQSAEHLNQATHGYFDPAVQALWEALEEAEDAQAVIAERHVPQAFSQVLIQQDSIVLASPQVKLSYNAIVQGDFADAVAAIARGMGVESALLQLGETVAIGQHPEGRAWSLAVKAPESEALLGVVDLKGRALAISSQAADAVGFDPVAGELVERELTVAVESAAGAAVADAFATAFIAAPEEQWQGLYDALLCYGLARVHLWGEEGLIASFVEPDVFDRKHLPPCCQ